MSKADELIRLLALGLDDREGLDKVTAILKEGLDWDHIIALAGQEGVIGLVYDRLKKNCLEQFVPGSVLVRLESIYYTYSAQNALIYEELARVVAALEQGGIPAIMLKGVFLASNIYKNIALRPMRDLDLLIRKEDVFSAVGILGKSGYKPIVPVKEQLENDFNYSLTLARENVGINNYLTVDLHWHIINASWLMGLSSGKFDIKPVWASAETAFINGIRMRVLSAEYLFISLAINAFTHCYERLILLVDCAEVLKEYKRKIDWHLVHEKARTCYLENILSYTLELVSQTASSGARPKGMFKREYRYFRPVLVYVCTQEGLIEKCKAFFRIIPVITRFLFKRLESKKT